MGPSGGRGVSWEQLPWLRLLGLSARLPGGPGKGGADRPEHAVALEGHTRVCHIMLEVGEGQRPPGEHMTLRPRGGYGAWGGAVQVVARAPGSRARPPRCSPATVMFTVHGLSLPTRD